MNKDKFMSDLQRALKNFSSNEKREILYDYEEHFSVGLENGKTEEEIVKELGDPENIARQYRTGSTIEHTDSNHASINVFRAIFAALSLGLFNIIIVLGPFLAIAAAVFSILITSAVVFLSGIIVSMSPVIKIFIPANIPDSIPLISVFLCGIGITSLGILLLMLSKKIGTFFLKLTLKYVNFNVNLITGRN